jgi:hypothetical protein
VGAAGMVSDLGKHLRVAAVLRPPLCATWHPDRPPVVCELHQHLRVVLLVRVWVCVGAGEGPGAVAHLPLMPRAVLA